MAGEGRIAEDLRDAAAQAAYNVLDLGANGNAPQIVVDAVTSRSPLDVEPMIDDPSTLVLILCVDGSLAELDIQGGAVGFHALPPFEQSRLVELTRGTETTDRDARRAEEFFHSLGKHVEWVGDGPGLVLGRIVCQLVNEAAFAVAEGVGVPEDVDTAMRHGYNYPRGPLEWADAIELDHVLAHARRAPRRVGRRTLSRLPGAAADGRRGPAGRGYRQRVLRIRRVPEYAPAGRD